MLPPCTLFIALLALNNQSKHLLAATALLKARQTQPPQLDALFSSLGALTFTLDSQQKSLYHAASVMACNYLVSLLEASHQMLKEAGIDEAVIDEAGVDKAVINSTENSSPLESLIRQTLDNYFSLGATQALTGPIARGDTDTIETHIKALQQAPDADLWKQLYSALGKATCLSQPNRVRHQNNSLLLSP